MLHISCTCKYGLLIMGLGEKKELKCLIMLRPLHRHHAFRSLGNCISSFAFRCQVYTLTVLAKAMTLTLITLYQLSYYSIEVR